MFHRSMQGLVAAALTASACGGAAPADEKLARAGAALDASNGSSLNGSSLNGSSLNGSSLNGSSLNGVSLNGSSLNGSSLNGVGLSGSQLVSVDARGRVLYGGAQMVGARFTGLLSNGGKLALRIDSATTGAGANSDVWFYGVSYQNASGWQPLCGLDATGAPVKAVAVLGTWDYSQGTSTGGSYTYSDSTFSLGCHAQGAIAKCVELGYKPWKPAPVAFGPSMRDLHVACTRMIRADYCGDGTPHTVNGREIDVYDFASIQTDTEPTWMFEAEWTPSGARCVSLLINDRYFKANLLPPLCMLSRATLTCGARAHFYDGTLLMDRDYIEL